MKKKKERKKCYFWSPIKRLAHVFSDFEEINQPKHQFPQRETISFKQYHFVFVFLSSYQSTFCCFGINFYRATNPYKKMRNFHFLTVKFLELSSTLFYMDSIQDGYYYGYTWESRVLHWQLVIFLSISPNSQSFI